MFRITKLTELKKIESEYVEDTKYYIELTRGDTAEFEYQLDAPVAGKCVLSVAKNAGDEPLFEIEGVFENNKFNFKILHEHTKDLEIGKYVYDIQYSAEGTVNTTTLPFTFEILAEVTLDA